MTVTKGRHGNASSSHEGLGISKARHGDRNEGVQGETVGPRNRMAEESSNEPEPAPKKKRSTKKAEPEDDG